MNFWAFADKHPILIGLAIMMVGLILLEAAPSIKIVWYKGRKEDGTRPNDSKR